ncbi:MAG: SAM-dependent methyltransferase [Deltaproteobacteria bacterium HGW-Deltaproteobacteria-14]|nr:MAG: SAM-dependent methyltransferase [Deltaproteobacteria bacterium HGW-Deltaproteobacteria-14]
MDRTPEPELMDAAAQADAYAAADFATSDAELVAAFLARFGEGLAGPVVDLGCGPGNIALRVARARPDLAVVGVDGAEAMLAVARSRAAALRNATFVRATLPSAALPAAAFGAVVSNSLLHHLHDPVASLWRTVLRVARPGAPVYVADLRRPPTPAAARAIVERYAAAEPEALRADFLASLHAAFEPDEIRAQLAAAGLAGWEVAAVGDRHVQVTGRLPA